MTMSPQKPPSPTSPVLAPRSAKRPAPPQNSMPPAKKMASAAALLVKRLLPTAHVPTRGSAHAAGYDLYAAEATTVPARGKVIVSTGLSISIPEGTYGRVAPRSGLASKHSIDTGAGVIDADYRGPVGVLLFNLGPTDFQVNRGDRVAQLILEKITTPEVEEVDDLPETARGAGGFGSTGGFGVATVKPKGASDRNAPVILNGSEDKENQTP